MNLHYCEIDIDKYQNGSAAYECHETEDGYLWVDNGEYANTVNYCPQCGYKAKQQNKTDEPD